MKRKCEDSELAGTEATVRRVTRSMRRKQQDPETRETRTGGTNIMDLPPEVQLQIFSRLSVRDLCQGVAPVCRKWSILARHPSFRKELSFGKDISRSSALKLLHESPLLRRLRLYGRLDTDAILRRVCRSNRHIETLEMVECRGAMKRSDVNGDILARILDDCPKLCRLELQGTLVKSLEFYRLLAYLCHRVSHITIRDATMRGMLCYLRTRAQLPVQRTGTLNGKLKDVDEMISVLSRKINGRN
jgi:hypothetical protein